MRLRVVMLVGTDQTWSKNEMLGKNVESCGTKTANITRDVVPKCESENPWKNPAPVLHAMWSKHEVLG